MNTSRELFQIWHKDEAIRFGCSRLKVAVTSQAVISKLWCRIFSNLTQISTTLMEAYNHRVVNIVRKVLLPLNLFWSSCITKLN